MIASFNNKGIVRLEDIVKIEKENFSFIDKPKNPIISFGKQLGRDEIHAGAISATATTITDLGLDYFAGGAITKPWKDTILSLIGPVLEKPGLIYPHIKEAIKEHRSSDKSLSECLNNHWHDAWKTLRADILFHDPSYSLYMFMGMQMFSPESTKEIALLSGLSFLSGIATAAGLDYKITELQHNMNRKKLLESGFDHERYFESRYLIFPRDKTYCAENVLQMIKEEFNFDKEDTRNYHDWYLNGTKHPKINERERTLRFRERTNDAGNGLSKTFQIIYTRPREIGKNDPTLFRCFPVEKEKNYYQFGHDTSFPLSSDKIKNRHIRKILEKNNRVYQEVEFKRLFVRDPSRMFVSTDIPPQYNSQGPYWIEVKVREDLSLLKQANEYIAWMFPVRGTTKNKSKISQIIP